MTMWADNVKFVKDIVDSKYAKIETAAADVRQSFKIQIQIKIQQISKISRPQFIYALDC